MKPFWFVIMLFGNKSDAAGIVMDFDAVYTDFIAPAIDAAGLQPVRADEEITRDIIHKPMFERLMLCEYAKKVSMIDHAKTDVFRDQVRYAMDVKQKLAEARGKGLSELKKIEKELKKAGG